MAKVTQQSGASTGAEGPRGWPGPFPSWWAPPPAPFPKDSTPEKAKSLAEPLILWLIHHLAACVFRKPPATTPHPTPCPPQDYGALSPASWSTVPPGEAEGTGEPPENRGTERAEKPLERWASPQGTRVSSSLGWGRGLSKDPLSPSSPHFPAPCWPPSPASAPPTSPWPSGGPAASLMQGPGQGAPMTAAA